MKKWFSNNWRKLIAFVILMLPAVGMLIGINISSDTSFGYKYFSVLSFIVLLVSVIGSFKGGRWHPYGEGRGSIGTFVRTFLSRLFIGELSRSFYGLFVFVMFAIILTAWLPDAFESGNLWFLSGTVFYFLSLVFMTAFVYPSRMKDELKDSKPMPARYLVFALSVPNNWEKVQDISCKDLRRNTARINILPLYVSLYYHLTHPERKLEKLFLVITRDGHLKDEETMMKIKDALRVFFNKMSMCLIEEGIKVKFRIFWWGSEYYPDVEPTIAENGEKTVDVKFIIVSDSNDVKGTFEEIKQCKELVEAIENDSKDVVIHLTGGTATMSIALMFHAIKGDTHAEYMKQGITDREPEELLVGIYMDVFDLEDIVRELNSYYERIYEKEKSY